MIHPHTRIAHIDDTVGLGVVATKLIPRGTITWVLDPMDRVLTEAATTRLGPSYTEMLDIYAYRDRRGRLILCWDAARFVNHSCAPTMLSPGGEYEIALRDIQPGEQLTDDYGSLNLDRPMDCACGEPGCRGVVAPEDFERCAPAWDAAIASAVARSGAVDQPLGHLLRPLDRSQLQRVVGGRSQHRSIMSQRFQGA